MASVYPTAAGNWSTRTWNNDATGAAYGMAPQVGDTVHANGQTITLDADITVVALSTRAGTTAAAGGSFTTSGTRTVNADSYAGSTNCLVLTGGSGSQQIGNSYGSNVSNSRYGTAVNGSCIQTGDSTGGNGSTRVGTSLVGGGIQNGNSQGGTAAFAYGSQVATGGIQNGNSTGGSASDAYGTLISSGGIINGDVVGGIASGAHGLKLNTGGFAFINNATGNTSGAFGVFSDATSRYVVIIKTESGSFPKSLSASAETTDTNVPFVNYNAGGASSPPIGPGGLVY